MHRFVDAFVIALLCLAPSGCAYVDTRFKDVTGDHKFDSGYRVGESYRLRQDIRLVACHNAPFGNTERFELWSPQVVAKNAAYANNGSRIVAEVPAGTLIHVDGSDYSYMFSFPPIPCGDASVLYAYGTIKSSVGNWSHVQLPYDQDVTKWSWIPGEGVLRPRPNYDLLEPFTPTTNVATAP